MNQRDIVNMLGSVATKENIKSVVSAAGAINPMAGIAAGIVGAIIVKAVGKAGKYIAITDEIPLIPPEPTHIMTFNESVSFLTKNNLATAFKDDIGAGDPGINPYTYRNKREKIINVAMFTRKAFDKDDPIYNAYFYGYINRGEYEKIWDNRKGFRNFKLALKQTIEPAKFDSMAKTIWTEMAAPENLEEIGSPLFGAVKEYLSDISDGVDLETVLKFISNK